MKVACGAIAWIDVLCILNFTSRGDEPEVRGGDVERAVGRFGDRRHGGARGRGQVAERAQRGCDASGCVDEVGNRRGVFEHAK